MSVRIADSRAVIALLAPMALCAAGAAYAADGAYASLDTITVTATGVSNMDAASTGDVSQAQIASQPLLRPAAADSTGTRSKPSCVSR